MRFLSFLVLLALVGAVGLFAYQNNRPVELTFANQGITTSLSLLAGAAYVAGMLSGWSVVGLFRRSWRGAMDRPRD